MTREKTAAMVRWARRLAIPAGLVVLVAVLATLQYRWVGQLADAERQRMQAGAQARAGQFADEVDREITSLFVAFSQIGGSFPLAGSGNTAEAEKVDNAAAFAAEYARWASTTQHARLIRALYLIENGDAGRAAVKLRKLTSGGTFEAADTPPRLASLVARLQGDDKARAFFPQVDTTIPGIVFPTARFRTSELGATPQHLRIMNVVGMSGCLVAELDRDYIQRDWLPALARRYFAGSDGFDYNLAVVDSNSGAFVYKSDAGLADGTFKHPDVKRPLLQIRFDQLEKFVAGRAGAQAGTATVTRSWQLNISGSRDRVVFRSTADSAGQWQLLLAHRAGSLEAAIGRSRHRNLAISFGILALLGVSVGLMVLSTRRAARLARQQVEFVAGVSHELRTPLSVICSAAENLADGVVAEGVQVRRYGELIANEGRRLTEMVEQVMAFAGLHAGRELTERQTVKVSEVIDAALAACAPAIGQRGAKVEKAIADDLPLVSVSARAMQRSLQNLLDNAIKYGGAAPWLRVAAERDTATGGVAITIEDRGVGIPAEEQRRIFEPFFRGREVANSAIHGSGLGLSLVKRIVEAHGGKVTVSSAAGRGSRFTVYLPAARISDADRAAQGVEEPAG